VQVLFNHYQQLGVAIGCLFSEYYCFHLSISLSVSSFELRKKNMTLGAKVIFNMNGPLDIIGVLDTIRIFGINGVSNVRPVTFHEGK
jgi:hypothetical protein